MDGVGAPTMRRAINRPLKRRINGAVMSALAVFVTLWPFFVTGLWVHNTFFNQPRKVAALSALREPEKLRVFDEPIISITFDDGWESAYTHGVPVLEKFGFPSTQFVLSGEFDDLSYMSKEQVLSLQEAGHDIESHTVTHADLKTMDDEDLQYQLHQSQVYLSKLIGHRVKAFAAPYDSYGKRELDVIKKYYSYHRNTYADLKVLGLNDINTAKYFDRYNIVGFSVTDTTTTKDIKRYLDYGKQHNAWVVLIYHEISDTSPSRYNTKPDEFYAQMLTVKNSGMKAATIAHVMQEYEKQQQNRSQR